MLYFCTDLTVILVPMELFQVVDGRAFPSTHALMIQPFKAIWQEDTSDDKGEAILALSFIELMCSPKKSNPFAGYDKDTRYTKLKVELYGDSTYQLPHLVIDGMSKYEELLENSSPTYSFLQSAFEAAHKLKVYFRTYDLGERTKGGAAVYKPKDITSALKEVSDVVKSLENTRTKVDEELLDEGKMRNNRQVGLFEE